MFFNLWGKNNYTITIIMFILALFFLVLININILLSFYKKILAYIKKYNIYIKVTNIRKKDKASFSKILSTLWIKNMYQLAIFLNKPYKYIKDNKNNYPKLIDLIINKLKWKIQS